MENIEKTIINQFLNTLNKREKSSRFEVIPLDKTEARKELGVSLPDYELYYNARLIGAVEVKAKLVFVDKVINAFRESIHNSYRFIIITDGRQLIVFDFAQSNAWRTPIFKGQLSESFDSRIFKERVIKVDDRLIGLIHRAIFNAFQSLKSTVKRNKQKTLIEKIDEKLIKDSYYVDSSKKEITTLSNQPDLTKKFEYILLNLLFDSVEPNRLIYRYTTLEAAFSTLNKTTYRINGIQGMNDQSEGFHILKGIYGSEFMFETNQNLAKRFNQIFISSCSTSADDLTMWRLYGENSKGVCLELEVLQDTRVPFFIKKVAYVKKDKQQILNTLFNLTRQIKSLGFTMNPELFSLILFFMKNNKYRIENEVRIVYDKALNNAVDNLAFKFDWGVAEPFKIIRPFVDISFLSDDKVKDVLPFRINKVILGPNFPKEIRNRLQFETLKGERGIDYIIIEHSKIERDLYIG